jgi:hypothetical protein
MAEKNLIKQIKVEETVHDLGGSIYNLDEVSSSTTEKDGEGNAVEYLVFCCGTATELID